MGLMKDSAILWFLQCCQIYKLLKFSFYFEYYNQEKIYKFEKIQISVIYTLYRSGRNLWKKSAYFYQKKKKSKCILFSKCFLIYKWYWKLIYYYETWETWTVKRTCIDKAVLHQQYNQITLYYYRTVLVLFY